MRLNFPVFSALLFSTLVLFAGCEERTRRPDGGLRADVGGPAMCGAGVTAYCLGNTEVACNADGTEGARRDCALGGGVCAPGLGCRACAPGRRSCEGNNAVQCNPDGSSTTVVDTCDPTLGEACSASGFCTSPCADAEASNSYIGCEYWPVPTTNMALSRDDFAFAVVVSNPQSAAANITVTRNGSMVATRTVAPGGTESITLPWVDGLQPTAGSEASALVRGGAYRLRSTLPVTVYQFNPLEFRIPRDCPDEDPFDPASTDGQCFSFTNDASLLLPTHVLTGNYLVTAYPSMRTDIRDRDFFGGYTTTTIRSPGYVSIVGVDEAPSTVRVTFTAPVLASLDGSVRAFGAGESGNFMLNQGDVLQLFSGFPSSCTPRFSDNISSGARIIDYCEASGFDLTGTEVRSSGRVAVLGGHNCAFVPYNRWACDHLEEAMFPLESWGSEAIVSITQPVGSEPNLIRIVSSHDANSLTFDPPSAHAPVTLNRTQFIEFEASTSFRVTGTDSFSVAQLLVGQNYAGVEATGTDVGDPSLSLGIPTEQFRTSYSFLAPSTYTRSYVNVTAPMDASVMLDGTPVTGFSAVGSTGYGVARVMISGGAHEMTGSAEFGIVVYGFGAFTSYMYPGGLDLEAIDVPF
jgi:hypothetical protein